MQYSLITNSSDPSIVVLIDSTNELLTYNTSHPKWPEIMELCESRELDDMSSDDFLLMLNENPVAEYSGISDRIVITSRGATFDGAPVDRKLAQGLKSALSSDLYEDDKYMDAMAKFLDKADSNPSMENSVDLYKWIASEKLTINQDGDVIGYKSVYSVNLESKNDINRFSAETKYPNGDTTTELKVLMSKDSDIFRSTVAGGGIVDGVEFSGYVPNYLGAVVEMPRDKVDSDGSVSCSVGLHVGTYDFASTFTGDEVLLVKFNPADVVACDPSHGFSKIRVCRYTVIGNSVESIVDSQFYPEDSYVAQYDDSDEDLTVENDTQPIDRESIVTKIINRIMKSKAN